MKKKNKIESEHSKRKAIFDRLVLKIEVLTFYGKGGHLKCCWKGCTESDPDCLQLDHINDDATTLRLPSGERMGGSGMYKYLKSKNFPPGFQTLCCSHNQKKELINRRNRGKL
jgi:hypothetical protein